MSQALITPEAIQIFSEEIQKCLPKFVPAFPSIQKGLILTLIISIIGIMISKADKDQNNESKDVLQKNRWIMIFLFFVYIGFQLGDILKDKDYTIRSLQENKQHFANTHWLHLYQTALKV